MTEPEHIAALHARYVQASGRPERLRFHERAWHDLLRAYQGDLAALTRDLGFAVWYLKGQIGRDQRRPGALRLRNLLQPDQFASDLAEAIGQCPKKYRAHCARMDAARRPSPPPPPPEAPPRPPDPKIAAGFTALKERLRGPQPAAHLS